MNFKRLFVIDCLYFLILVIILYDIVYKNKLYYNIISDFLNLLKLIGDRDFLGFFGLFFVWFFWTVELSCYCEG